MSLLTLLALTHAAHAWTPSTGATWNQSLPWQLNNSGSASVPNLTQVESLLVTSYQTWSAPACTAFADSYNGTTSRLSSNNGDGYTVHGFLQRWPSGYGDPYSVIGITTAIYSGTDMVEADVSFNEDVYVFTLGAPSPFAYEADLQSIATHELGHSLGMGHTNVTGATMFPTYDNGTGTRTLANDDITGVCTLYPSGTTLPTDDAFEPNDEAQDAVVVGCGDRVQGTAANQDWFAVVTDRSGPIAATLAWTDSSVDLDLYLFDEADELDSSLAETGAQEQVRLAQVPAGTYWFLINPYSGAASYVLDITCDGEGGGEVPTLEDVYEDNDQADMAAGITCPAVIEGYAGDQDWYVFETTSTGGIRASLTWSDGSSDLDLYLADTTEILAGSEALEGSSEATSLPDAAAGTYAVIVNPYLGADAYRLELECDGVVLLGDTGDDSVIDTDDVEVFAGCACQQGGSNSLFALLLALVVGRRRRAE
jgi:hypothetical protein